MKKSEVLQGKTCLITGATSGIGRSSALQLSKMGADICFIARSENKAESLSKEIFELTKKKPFYIIADLSSLHEIERAANEFINSKKKLHILLNNAGIVNTGERDWNVTWDLTTYGDAIDNEDKFVLEFDY